MWSWAKLTNDGLVGLVPSETVTPTPMGEPGGQHHSRCYFSQRWIDAVVLLFHSRTSDGCSDGGNNGTRWRCHNSSSASVTGSGAETTRLVTADQVDVFLLQLLFLYGLNSCNCCCVKKKEGHSYTQQILTRLKEKVARQTHTNNTHTQADTLVGLARHCTPSIRLFVRPAGNNCADP